MKWALKCLIYVVNMALAVRHYKWRSKCGGMGASMISYLKELEAKNARLKKMYAEAKMDSELLKAVLQKKVVKPLTRNTSAQWLVSEKQITIERACQFGCD